MDEVQRRVAMAISLTKPDPGTMPQSYGQWQKMAHHMMEAVHLPRLAPHDTREFMRQAGMTVELPDG